MAFDLNKIRAALQKNATGGKTQTYQKSKYYKPTIGEHQIRFLPFSTSEGQPFLEVQYYEKITSDGKRIVAPFGFGLPDPVRDVFNDERKKKDGWAIAKHLKPKKRFYGLVIDRADEAAGPQIWEFGEDVRDAVYTNILSKDYEDEFLFDPETGYDYTLTVTQATDTGGKPKTFNGSPVKKLVLNIRKKPSLLHKDEAQRSKWVAEMPKLEEMFKKQCKTPDELIEILENFVAKIESEQTTAKSASSGQTETPVAPEPRKAAVSEAESDADDNMLDKVFDGV